MVRTLELRRAAGVVAAHEDRALAAAESPLPLGTRARRLLQSPSPWPHCGSGTRQLTDRRVTVRRLACCQYPAPFTGHVLVQLSKVTCLDGW